MEREPFDDHKPPRLERIEPFCARVKEWLDEHEDNVVVIHCKAGKVRYGTTYGTVGKVRPGGTPASGLLFAPRRTGSASVRVRSNVLKLFLGQSDGWTD